MESGRWENAAGAFSDAMRAAFAQGRPTGQDAQVTMAFAQPGYVACANASYLDSLQDLQTSSATKHYVATYHAAVPCGCAPRRRIIKAKPCQGGAAHSIRRSTVRSGGAPPPCAGAERRHPQHGGRQLWVSLCWCLYSACKCHVPALQRTHLEDRVLDIECMFAGMRCSSCPGWWRSPPAMRRTHI